VDGGGDGDFGAIGTGLAGGDVGGGTADTALTVIFAGSGRGAVIGIVGVGSSVDIGDTDPSATDASGADHDGGEGSGVAVAVVIDNIDRFADFDAEVGGVNDGATASEVENANGKSSAGIDGDGGAGVDPKSGTIGGGAIIDAGGAGNRTAGIDGDTSGAKTAGLGQGQGGKEKTGDNKRDSKQDFEVHYLKMTSFLLTSPASSSASRIIL